MPGCGAEIVFDTGDAVANCAFCGRSLVRKAFVNAENIPELIVPFSITNDEAKKILNDWCIKNKHKKEAKAISGKLADIKGFYLPYELVKPPLLWGTLLFLFLFCSMVYLTAFGWVE